MLKLGTQYVMDCKHRLDICKASRINSWKKIAKPDNLGRLVPAVQNCKIVFDLHHRIISVEAIKNIKRFEELFVEYHWSNGL